MGVHSYHSEELNLAYKGNAYQKFIKAIIKDKEIGSNFCDWLNTVDLKFNTEDKRKNPWTYEVDFETYSKYINNKGMSPHIAYMLHEYLHQLMHRMYGWLSTEVDFSMEEFNFIEDMYINAWMMQLDKETGEAWQVIIQGDRDVKSLSYNEKEKEYISLLTPNYTGCNIDLTNLHKQVYTYPRNLLDKDFLDKWIDEWHTALHDREISTFVNGVELKYEKARQEKEKRNKNKEANSASN